jgi:predicted rRNA methylase YqxC with S4 and FtsJ domains
MVFRSIWMEKIGRSIISIWRGYNKMDMKLREKGRVHVQEEVQQGV